jgi:Putative peptidoglycan binding domain/Caspase domain
MARAPLMAAFLGLAFAWCGMPAARSDQLRIALVISNEEYAGLPGLERCSASAAAVRDALRGKGFRIVERGNLERGEFVSAIGALSRRIVASPPTLAVLYYCGYAQEFDGQSFLLPTSAAIARDYDVLTQGINSKSLVDSLGGAPQSTGFVLLDVFRTPNAAAPTGLGRLIEQVTSSTFAVIGASNDGPGEGPTAASLALRDQVAEGEMNLDMFVVEMRRQLSKDTAVAAQFVPATGGPSSSGRTALRTSPPPAPATPAASIAIAPSPAPVPPAASNAVPVPPQPPAPPAPAASIPVPIPPLVAPVVRAASIAVPAELSLAPAVPAASTAVPVPPPAPTEPPVSAALPASATPQSVPEQMKLSAQDKRLIQTILADMGYYAGQVDGRFGPETRAAVRRYQFEIKADVTGRLTADQASRLLCLVLCPPAPPKRDDVTYCAELSALYRRYLDNSGEGSHFPEVTASVAMDDCVRGNTAAGIPVLERKLRDGRFTAPPRG